MYFWQKTTNWEKINVRFYIFLQISFQNPNVIQIKKRTFFLPPTPTLTIVNLYYQKNMKVRYASFIKKGTKLGEIPF